MFTLEQIKEVHSKTKTGADFPQYVQDLIQLGVIGYDAYVSDGHVDYYGIENLKISNPARYEALNVNEKNDIAQFKIDIKAHQQGETDYPTFCNDCAKSGIERWVLCFKKMTCTYYDKVDNKLLVENIPLP